MKRRTYLATLGTAAVASLAGCTGERVLSVQPGRPIRVPRGRGTVITIPAEGDAISYTARDDQRFGVYFFITRADYLAYMAFIDGDDPDRTPRGDTDIGSQAVPVGDGSTYEASTPDGGRVPIEAEGEAYFVIDHSRYRFESVPPETADPLSVTLELTVTRSPLPF
ncbi:MAG: hypothetical protein ABEJ86_01715 [Halococcoides sp.]